MRKFLTIVTLSLLGTVAHAETDNQLFKCVDKATLALNSECVSSQITDSSLFKQAQQNIITQADVNSDFVVATISLDPETLNIEVVAHHDALMTARVLTTKPN